MKWVKHLAEDLVHLNPLRGGPDPTYADGDDSLWLDLDWSQYVHFHAVKGSRLCYVDTGGKDLPALLFIHGLSGSWQNWLLNIPAFMDRYRVIAVDLPGFGRSDLPHDPLSIVGYAAAVDSLCCELGIESASIVGSSMGGQVAAELAIKFPLRVKHLVLVSAAGLSPDKRRRGPILAAAEAWSFTSTWVLGHREILVWRPRLRQLALHAIFRHPERLSAPLIWELIQGAGKAGFLPALEAITSQPLVDRLEKVTCPTLIMWGRDDAVVSYRDSQVFKDAIGPKARVVSFNNTGHLPMVERPSRFNRELDIFLSYPDREQHIPAKHSSDKKAKPGRSSKPIS